MGLMHTQDVLGPLTNSLCLRVQLNYLHRLLQPHPLGLHR